MFKSSLLNYNTVFVGRVFDSRRPGRLPLTLIPGDVAAERVAEGDDLSVITAIGKRVHTLDVHPTPFTPNGDGANDETTITYGLVNLTTSVPVSVVVYDLAGQRRKTVYSGLDASRKFGRRWDGTDDDGQKLPPGLYIVRLEVDEDSGVKRRSAIVPILY